MQREDAFRASATVIEAMPRGRFRVELANGHRLVARGARAAAQAGWMPGSQVVVRLLPSDLSRGRIETAAEEREL